MKSLGLLVFLVGTLPVVPPNIAIGLILLGAGCLAIVAGVVFCPDSEPVRRLELVIGAIRRRQ